ncbi:dienelactone hydrolase family protein [Cryomorphaceae bacterium 1068]|nr:dienelactone hydrolase family protein [Cryomorphaceae bacterium 1068]
MIKQFYFLFLTATVFFFSSCGSEPNVKESIDEESLITEMSIVGEEVSYTSDSVTMKGYIAYDETDTTQRPGIIVVHEWWGHTDYVRERAEMLAELGYVALAVDMYGDGKKAEHPDNAMKFSGMVMQNMDGAESRFTEAIKVLKNHPQTADENISAIGYCFGGSLILAMANKGVDLDGVAAFHSGVQLPVGPSENLHAMVLVQNGADDPFVSPESVANFKAAMDSLQKPYVYESYPGAVHAYTNKNADSLGEKFNLPLAYNAEADTKSWERMKEFFNELYPRQD